ncbi:helix-turn-helix domain-containing protein [Parapedobacter tibetensis]|uniref:helix-turn-helix domain-containing protein n=1 Tax=Parapedobacter tibetensis TaxID=2972951 RepID=UPI00214D3068|nr:helix-turn-helix transcriptional regulator [Parapedobacter tibetensis]
MEIGPKLRKLREQYGFSQEYVATELGISQAAYHKIEVQQIRLSVDRAKQLAKIYDIDPEYFYSTEASVVHNNYSSGSYSNSNNGTIEKYENNNVPKELVDLLREELKSAKEERKIFTTLIEKLINNKKL